MSWMRSTASQFVPTTTTARRPTTAPILAPMGRLANHPPERTVRAGTVISYSWNGGDWGLDGENDPFPETVDSILWRVARVPERKVGHRSRRTYLSTSNTIVGTKKG